MCGEVGVAGSASKLAATGTTYPYFICDGRHSRRATCTRRSMPIAKVEQRVEDYYLRVEVPEQIVVALREMLIRQFDVLH
jgi:hypothetical protein